MVTEPQLVPTPRSLGLEEGVCHLPRPAAVIASAGVLHDSRLALQQLADAMQQATGHRPELSPAWEHPARCCTCSIDEGLAPQAYRLHIGDQIELTAGDAAGLFHGVQTLRQLLQQYGPALPCLRIDDAPDLPVRGFYHDATRGKVETLATYKLLADQLAFYKLNQLQLYVEHTFAFSWMPDLWTGADPLTAEEIVELDAYCAARHIELVPSLSCFGHSYTLIRSPRREHLNELDVQASEMPYSIWDRMGHYTLDSLNDESVALVARMIGEFAPLFRSKLFNICCDETFDLGKGKHADKAAGDGVSRLYIDFVKKVVDAVHAVGCTPMLWGDVLHKHPEHAEELQQDAIVLDWNYGAKMEEERNRMFADSGRPFYVCPGCQTWMDFLPNLDTASLNINRFARLGAANGALGLLNTDWGDHGHVSMLANSWYGLAYGAECAWHIPGDDETAHQQRFDAAFSTLEIGDDGEVVRLLRAMGSASPTTWKKMAFNQDPSTLMPEDWRSEHTGIADSVLKQDATAVLEGWRSLAELRAQLEVALAKAQPRDERFRSDVALGAWGVEISAAAQHLLQKVDAIKRGEPDAVPASDLDFARTADDLRHFENAFTAAWHARNKPSEAFRIRRVLVETAMQLDRFGRDLGA